MKWDFRKIPLRSRDAFTLIEVTVALLILGMITATVLVVVNRAVDTVVLWQTKMQAFDIARENMEKILAQQAVADSVEYGTSEENPDITWETVVESFYEPVTSNMWIRAICSAKFVDDSGQEQKIEFTHWVTSLNKQQVLQILEQEQREREYYAVMGEDLDEDSQDQATDEPEGEQEPETDPWDDLVPLLGPPPKDYNNWSQVPKDVFWDTVIRKLFSNK